MQKIDTEKLTKELKDTLLHRKCVMKSGEYLAAYLTCNNRSVDAIRIIGRCSVHDISKIQNTEEFMALASIVNEMDDMKNIEHTLSESQRQAIQLHWKNNSHHPEFYDSPNDMTDLDLMEMACDCHARSKQYGTDLIQYITAQQNLRFHFDKEHLKRLLFYCSVLVKLSKNDDYSSELNNISELRFVFKDKTLQMLENFDISLYSDVIKTDRLYLKKKVNSDFASVVYDIYLKEDNSIIGEISLKGNGIIDYKIYQNYNGNDYDQELISTLIDVTLMSEVQTTVKKDNDEALRVMRLLGFKQESETENTVVFKLKKRNS